VREPAPYRCPICDRRFQTQLDRDLHVTTTQQHEHIVEHCLSQRFMLAEYEYRIEQLQQQRNHYRSMLLDQKAIGS
jgi:hypothetical protein